MFRDCNVQPVGIDHGSQWFKLSWQIRRLKLDQESNRSTDRMTYIMRVNELCEQRTALQKDDANYVYFSMQTADENRREYFRVKMPAYLWHATMYPHLVQFIMSETTDYIVTEPCYNTGHKLRLQHIVGFPE